MDTTINFDPKIAALIAAGQLKIQQEEENRQECRAALEQGNAILWAAVTQEIREILPEALREYMPILGDGQLDVQPNTAQEFPISIPGLAPILVKTHKDKSGAWVLGYANRNYGCFTVPAVNHYDGGEPTWDWRYQSRNLDDLEMALVKALASQKFYEEAVAEYQEREAAKAKTHVPTYVPVDEQPVIQNTLMAELVTLIRDVVREEINL